MKKDAKTETLNLDEMLKTTLHLDEMLETVFAIARARKERADDGRLTFHAPLSQWPAIRRVFPDARIEALEK